MHNFNKTKHDISMKKFMYFISFMLVFAFFGLVPTSYAAAEDIKTAKMVIVIDDFGSWDQSGVSTMLSIDAPLTCAVMPMVDNSTQNARMVREANKEVILHMPMEAYVHLPDSWYGPMMIGNYDSREDVFKKLTTALYSIEGASGFNIHIGSGVCLHEDVVSAIYDWSKENKLPFLDSRTHINTICEKVAKDKNIKYLGRDEFLEPEGDRSYNGVVRHLLKGAEIAKEKGYSIVIGHVGVHGGENTAKAIKDTLPKLKEMGIEIVTLSNLYTWLGGSF